MPSDPPTSGTPTATSVACPACGHPFAWPPVGRCGRCAVDLTSPAATEVFDLDRRWAALAAERLARVRDLEDTRPRTAPPVWEPPPPPRPAAGGRGVPALLGLAGAALLTAAAVVFTAVAWTTLPAPAKAAVLLAATAAAAAGALRLNTRGTTTAAAALGTLTMALALVDVVGSDRVGLVDLGDLAIPLGLVAAAGAGWWLGRRDVGWVAETGAVAAGLGAFGLTMVVAADLSAPGTTIVGTGAAALLAASALTWPTGTARRIAALLAGAGVVLAGLVALSAVADGRTSVGAGLAATAVPLGLAAVAMLRTRWALAVATVLATGAVAATAAAVDAEGFGLAAVVAGAAATAAWAATVVDPRWRGPLLVGAAPVLAATIGSTADAAATAVERLGRLTTGAPVATLDGWAALSVPLAAGAAAAWPAARRRPGTLGALVVLVVAGTLPTTAAWMALASVAVLAVLVDRFGPRVPDDVAPAALAVALGGMAWSRTDAWSLAFAAVAATAVAAHVAWHGSGPRATAAAGIGTASAGLATAATLDAAGLPSAVALGAALVVVLGLAALLHWWMRDRPDLTTAGTATAAVATIVVPVLVDSAPAAGTLLLVAAAGWLAVAVAGWVPARWVVSAASSAGTAVLLADAGVDVVEAYTAVPAVTLGLVGVLWLRRDPQVRTLAALWPALSVALVPSLLVLAADPHVLLRTLLLTGLAGALAGVGVRLRWLAPALAGAVTAVGVALSQLAVVVGIVPRWVAFAGVGGVLVWLAATYERQQQRARAVGTRLVGFR